MLKQKILYSAIYCYSIWTRRKQNKTIISILNL